MTTDNKTLADVQPGGRVRLGDQAERARFEQYRGGDFERDAHGYYTNPRTAQDWAMWQAALSAQPSPGGQEYAWNIAELVRADLDRQSCPDAYMRIAMESVVNHLAARQPVGQIPAGFVLVPEKFGIPAEVWEGVEFVIGGPGTGEGEAYLDSTAWVGDLIQDDGSAVYGLHLSCDECPEEGSVTLSKFTARAEVQP